MTKTDKVRAALEELIEFYDHYALYKEKNAARYKQALSELDGMVKNLENAHRQLKSLMVFDAYDCSCVEDTDWQAQCKLMYEYAEDAAKLIAPYVGRE